ncbi:hypothetical protein GN956_G13429 [Arapaima gigas]
MDPSLQTLQTCQAVCLLAARVERCGHQGQHFGKRTPAESRVAPGWVEIGVANWQNLGASALLIPLFEGVRGTGEEEARSQASFSQRRTQRVSRFERFSSDQFGRDSAALRFISGCG